jgi:hypothetical protein
MDVSSHDMAPQATGHTLSSVWESPPHSGYSLRYRKPEVWVPRRHPTLSVWFFGLNGSFPVSGSSILRLQQ